MTGPNGEQLSHIYTAYIKTAERNIDRRFLANRFFFTIAAGIAIAASVLLGALPSTRTLYIIGTIVLAALIFNSVAWTLAVAYFRRLSSVKYAVLQEVESVLSVKPFTREWEIMKAKRGVLPGNTIIELGIPMLIGGAAVLCWIVLLLSGDQMHEHLMRLRLKS
jgi:hypothetical protein